MRLEDNSRSPAAGRDQRPRPLNLTWALAAALLGALLLLGLGCDVAIEIGDDGDDGPTETRDDSFSVGEPSTMGESPVLIVTSDNGWIEVEAGPAGTVRVQATLRNAPKVDYEASQDGNTITVEARVESGAHNAGADITVTAPSQTAVELETSNGRIEIRGMGASGALRTSNGRVVMEEVRGHFDVRASNGPIMVTSMEGVGTLITSNGSVTMENVDGTFEVETSNGNITFSGKMTPGGDNLLETSNGNVTVELLGTPSVSLDASTSRGKVTIGLPIETTLTKPEHLVGTIGGGEAELVILASNGSVVVE